MAGVLKDIMRNPVPFIYKFPTASQMDEMDADDFIID